MNNQSNLTFAKLANEPNGIQAAIQQVLINSVNTLMPAKIIEVNTDGTYDLELLCRYLDTNGSPIPTPNLVNIPRAWFCGSSAGLIIELIKGDSVLIGICQRDITSVKKNWTVSNPQSFRTFSLNDAIIIAVLTNTEPTTYVKITPDNIELKATNISINGKLVINNIAYEEHKHSAGQYTAPNGPVDGISGEVKT